MIDGIQTYESVDASPWTGPWISSVCPSSVITLPGSGDGMSGFAARLAPNIGLHCFTFAAQVFLISATVAG